MPPGNLTFRIIEEDDGTMVLLIRAQDRSRVRRELEEISARATERRRFRDAESGES